MNLLFQLKRGFDSTQCGDPVIGLSLGNILEDHASTSHVLVLDELHGMIALLFGVGLEPLGKSRKSNVITVKVSSLRITKVSIKSNFSDYIALR